VRRRKLPADRVGVPLIIERWTCPDGLCARGVRPADRQLTKTRAALDLFFTTS
jgi:hypothetical protein